MTVSNRLVLLVAALAGASLVTAPAAAQATLLSGYGGTAGYGADCLGMNDDGSSLVIDLTPYFPAGLRFFSRTHTVAYVNTNGNVTFAGALPTFTPLPFPVADQPMIAPFWADVDTRTRILSGGPIRCNGPGSGVAVMGPVCDNPTEDGLWWHLEPGLMVVTWDRTARFLCANTDGLRDSFQLVLRAVPTSGCGTGTVGSDFDVEFRYNRCDWEVGMASGDSSRNGQCEAGETFSFRGTTIPCVPGQAGFDEGVGAAGNFYAIPGSRTHGIAAALCSGSNTVPAQPGIWQFQVRSGVVMTCPGAGATCSVPGVMGVCAQGRMSCAAGSSTPTCTQQITPLDERCDNQDNDCDGSVDETDMGNLCSSFQVCQAGTCVEGCFEGTCPAGYTCDSAHCVDPMCVGVTCGAGERCAMGACVQPCNGVVCPHGQSCTMGRCVDPCSAITCDACTACVDGTCETRCTATSCAAGQECAFATGVCVPTGCGSVSCPAGQYCAAGTCMDSCAGATCPAGQVCSAGDCVPMVGMQDAAVGPVDVGIVFNDANIMSVDTGPSTGMDAAVMTHDAGPLPRRTSGACGCTVQTSERPWPIALAAMTVLALATRRRRRASRRAR